MSGPAPYQHLRTQKWNRSPLEEHELVEFSRSPDGHFARKKSMSGVKAAIWSWSRHDSSSMLARPRRSEQQLEQDLQSLVDAQAEGLMAGVHLDSADDMSSDASGSQGRRPNTRQRRTTGDDRYGSDRRPRTRKLSLRGARAGILVTIRELASVKDEEVDELRTNRERSSDLLHQVDHWKEKSEGLQKEIHRIEESAEVKMRERLVEEDIRIKEEIRDLEGRLLQLRAKQRHLASEMSTVTNSVDAKLSSYKASLSILDSQVKQFLAKPPVTTTIYGGSANNVVSFWSLPRQRRTLDMAREHWADECHQLIQRQEQAEFERDALEDGAQVWEDVMGQVSALERNLRHRIQRMASTQRSSVMLPQLSHAPMKSVEAASHHRIILGHAGSSIEDLTTDMNHTISLLESKLQLAQVRNWKLLVCCIGAELEALREGYDIILDSFGSAIPPSSPGRPSSVSSSRTEDESLHHVGQVEGSGHYADLRHPEEKDLRGQDDIQDTTFSRRTAHAGTEHMRPGGVDTKGEEEHYHPDLLTSSNSRLTTP